MQKSAHLCAAATYNISSPRSATTRCPQSSLHACSTPSLVFSESQHISHTMIATATSQKAFLGTGLQTQQPK